jgi:hypothetical protein
VQKTILESYPDEDLRLFIVWIRIQEIDSIEAAEKASTIFGTDPRVLHFYDSGQFVGRAIAEGFGGDSGEVAWDVYIFYDGEDKWEDRLPVPIDWCHQAPSDRWADPERLRIGDELTKELAMIVEKILEEKKTA